MPKLEDIHIASSPLTDRMYIGTLSKRDPGAWSQKRDCTGVFLGALMGWCEPGTVRIVTDNHGGDGHAKSFPTAPTAGRLRPARRA